MTRAAGVLLAAALLAGCLGETPERARISQARLLDTAGGPQLEVTQQLHLSPTMLDALGSGIPLRLVYRIDRCSTHADSAVIELRYTALTRSYELRQSRQPVRRFSRRSALLAALDRVRLPLSAPVADDCTGVVAVALDLTSLPTPLRFPALLRPDDWRLVSPPTAWQAARA